MRVTGALLVGGESRRFGGPKALARLNGETLAERGWRVLGEVFDERLAVGKTADGLPLPFPVLDDGSDVRAPIAGVVAALRAAANDICVVLPVDCPLIPASVLRSLAEACADAAVPPTGPLPGAYRRSALTALESRLQRGRLALREALRELATVTVAVDEPLLLNVNTPDDLEAVRALTSAAPDAPSA